MLIPAISPVPSGAAPGSVGPMNQRDIDGLIMQIKRRVVAREIARRAGRTHSGERRATLEPSEMRT
jgi:hypothetical protein